MYLITSVTVQAARIKTYPHEFCVCGTGNKTPQMRNKRDDTWKAVSITDDLTKPTAALNTSSKAAVWKMKSDFSVALNKWTFPANISAYRKRCLTWPL